MRQCPACQRQYTDDLTFCLEDGATLADVSVDDGDVETQFARVPGTFAMSGSIGPRHGYRKRSGVPAILIALVLFLAGGLVLAAAGLGGYFYYLSRQSEVDRPLPYPAPSPTISRTPNPSAVPWPSPTPSKTIDDDLTTVDPATEKGQRPPVPKQISGGVLNGKAINLPKPPYPPAARAVRASGAVSVQVLVDEKGNVVTASAVSGHPLLRQAAVQAARSAKFNPTLLSGQAVKVSGVITYNFVPDAQ